MGWGPHNQVVAPAQAPVRTAVATGSVGARNGRPGAGALPIAQQQDLARQAMQALAELAPPTDVADVDRWTSYVQDRQRWVDVLATINPEVVDEETRELAKRVMAQNETNVEAMAQAKDAVKNELERTQEARRRLAQHRRHPDNTERPPSRISTKA